LLAARSDGDLPFPKPMKSAMLAAKESVPGECGLGREEAMAVRSSLFALVATTCIAASFPASAVLINYIFVPGTTACFDINNPCQESISFSGSFSVDISTNPAGEVEITFPSDKVNIILSNLADNLLPTSPTTLSIATPIDLGFGSDLLSFNAGGVGHNTVVTFQLNKPINEGGLILLLPSTSIMDPSFGMIFPVTVQGGFTSVPEPSSLVAMVSAMGLLGLVGWRHKSK
jgi:hypothetical protein